MTPEQKQHLKGNVRATSKLMIEKYVAGQKEHKGNLWEKSGMLRNAENEVADLNNYLPTLRRQIEKVKDLLPDNPALAKEKLENILSESCG